MRESVSEQRETKTWRALVGVIAFALLVRGGVLAARHTELESDPDGYCAIAENLAITGVFGREQSGEIVPTAFRPPLYPLVLSCLTVEGHVSGWAVGVLQLVLGVATVGLVFALARAWQLGNWAILASLMVACDPILLNQATLVMTETLATFLAVVSLLCLSRLTRNPTATIAALAGASLALAGLCRPTFLVWLAAVALALLLARRATWKRGLANVIVCLIAALLVLAPWTYRNSQQFGTPIVATTHGGYTLLLGNNRHFYRHVREQGWSAVWDARPLQQELDEQSNAADSSENRELQMDRVAYRAAVTSIQDEPGMFVQSCLLRITRLWSPLPNQTRTDEPPRNRLLRYAAGVWYGVIYSLAFGGVLALRGKLLRQPWLWGVLLCIAFTALHAFYWSNMRMRAPLVPVVCLLAAAGAAFLAGQFRRRK